MQRKPFRDTITMKRDAIFKHRSALLIFNGTNLLFYTWFTLCKTRKGDPFSRLHDGTILIVNICQWFTNQSFLSFRAC